VTKQKVLKRILASIFFLATRIFLFQQEIKIVPRKKNIGRKEKPRKNCYVNISRKKYREIFFGIRKHVRECTPIWNPIFLK